MTKAKTPDAPAAVTDVLAQIDTEPGDSLELKSYWQREAALRFALDFHKNNGGMLTPPQLVDHARIFSTFLQGETK